MADLRVERPQHGDRDQSHTWPPHINGSSENVPRRLMNPSLSLLPVINHPAIPFLLYYTMFGGTWPLGIREQRSAAIPQRPSFPKHRILLNCN